MGLAASQIVDSGAPHFLGGFMARTVTFAELKDRSRRRGDFVNNNFISDAELEQYINDSIAELYDLLVSRFGNDYYFSEDTITLVSGQIEYDLPSDFYKMVGVDLQLSASGERLTMKPFMFVERNRDQEFDPYRRYRIVGNTFRLMESSTNVTSGGIITLYYIPAPTILTDDADTFDGISGWEEYVIIDAAIKMRVKEETDTKDLELAKQRMIQRINDSADNRDVGQSERVTDVRTIDYFEDSLFYDT